MDGGIVCASPVFSGTWRRPWRWVWTGPWGRAMPGLKIRSTARSMAGCCRQTPTKCLPKQRKEAFHRYSGIHQEQDCILGKTSNFLIWEILKRRKLLKVDFTAALNLVHKKCCQSCEAGNAGSWKPLCWDSGGGWDLQWLCCQEDGYWPQRSGVRDDPQRQQRSRTPSCNRWAEINHLKWDYWFVAILALLEEKIHFTNHTKLIPETWKDFSPIKMETLA